jgi:hypothetical protein
MKRHSNCVLAASALVGLAFGFARAAAAPTVLVETEGFRNLGGWVIDQQFMDQMGSPFVLAHGLGVPVAEATTTVEFPAPGKYRVFVRTRDWVAPWKAPGAPGRFEVLVGGKALKRVFGTEGADWHWQDGGTVEISGKSAAVALHDLAGFEGRCDAIVFSSDPSFVPPNAGEAMAQFRRKALALPDRPEDAGEFDLVVVGGGMAGTCAALSAARLGVKIALIQDRPVLGGNNSSEVRVWLQGSTNHPPFPRIGDLVRELEPKRRGHPGTADMYEDDKKLSVVEAAENLFVFLGFRANEVETAGTHLRAVVAQNVLTGRRVRFVGRWFADCTGDGCIGALAGADFEMTLPGHMGPSNLWDVTDTGAPAPFPHCPWAFDMTGKPFPDKLDQLGKWFWETGFDYDPIERGENIRDTNLRGMYGAWDCLKNARKLYPNHRLAWAAYVSGKRESRRLLGDVLLTKDDVIDGKPYPDGCVPASWSIDLHLADPRYNKGLGSDAFISEAHFTHYNRPYWVPYRCLYSRNVTNLFMAGRDISVTHEALGTVRVQRTTGMMGEVVGMAASLCKKHDTAPRGVYENYLEELKGLMNEGIGNLPPDAGLDPPDWLSGAGDNFAHSAQVTVSSCLDADKYPPVHLTDGEVHTWNNDLRWVSERTMPQQVELSWDQPQTLSAARLLSGYRDGGGNLTAPLADFTLQYLDGAEWRDLEGAKVTGNAKFDWSARFPEIRTSKLRLVVTAADGNTARLWEIELYNPPKE